MNDDRSTHILKHKNLNVAHLWMEKGNVLDITELPEKEHLPFRFEEDKEKNIRLLNNWLGNRGIPFSREDYDEIMEKYNVKTSKELTVLANGLNLTDHYWICEKNFNRHWEEGNFHDNKFSSRIGQILPELAEKYEEFANPDLSSNGRLKKFWVIDGERRVLCKDGSGDLKQEPFNECIASKMAEKLGIDAVNYKLTNLNEKIYCSCDCMIDSNIELVSAFNVFLEKEKGMQKGKYYDYIEICEGKGIKNAKENIDKMIILDYLIRNTDRNPGNYGILRNSENLEWVKTAPVFDCGNSFWYNAQAIKYIDGNTKSECRSFLGENEKNIKLVDDTKWFDKKLLNDMPKIMNNFFRNNKNMDAERINKIISEYDKRLLNLEISLNNRQSLENKKPLHRRGISR
jgi:hypothetical protein